MKKIFGIAVLLCGMFAVQANAQVEWDEQPTTPDSDLLSEAEAKAQLDAVSEVQETRNVWGRKKYFKIGYVSPTVERVDGTAMEWDSDYSLFIQQGRTAYFHSKPIAGLIKIGLDYGFMDVTYTKLKLKDGASYSSDESLLDLDLGMHKFEYALHIGPSISINPFDHFIVAAYFHVMPMASGILENDKFSYGFGCAMAAGASISYKLISFGVESVWCNKIKYKQTDFDSDSADYDYDYESGNVSIDNIFSTEKFQLKQSSPRIYFALRF